MCRLKTVQILKPEGESTRFPSAVLSARVKQQYCWLAGAGAGWAHGSSRSALRRPQTGWEKHVHECSVAILVKWLSFPVRRPGANNKSSAVNSPYPGDTFLMTLNYLVWHRGRTGTPLSPSGGAVVLGRAVTRWNSYMPHLSTATSPFHSTPRLQESHGRNGETEGTVNICSL